jgi:hypothetical protein
MIWGHYSGKEGEKSPTSVKYSIRRKSNIEILMAKYGFMGSYWLLLIRPQEKFRTLNFFFHFFEQNILQF